MAAIAFRKKTRSRRTPSFCAYWCGSRCERSSQIRGSYGDPRSADNISHLHRAISIHWRISGRVPLKAACRDPDSASVQAWKTWSNETREAKLEKGLKSLSFKWGKKSRWFGWQKAFVTDCDAIAATHNRACEQALQDRAVRTWSARRPPDLEVRSDNRSEKKVDRLDGKFWNPARRTDRVPAAV